MYFAAGFFMCNFIESYYTKSRKGGTKIRKASGANTKFYVQLITVYTVLSRA